MKEREKERGDGGTMSGGKGKEREKEMPTSRRTRLFLTVPQLTKVHISPPPPFRTLSKKERKKAKGEARIPLKSSISLHLSHKSESNLSSFHVNSK